MNDFIDEYLSITEDIPTAESFRVWTAIFIISSVLERRVWTVTDAPRPLFPNSYILLAGEPAAGKGNALEVAKSLLAPLVGPDGLYLAPDNPTAATFLDSFEKSAKPSRPGMETMFYSSMAALCFEFGSLMSKYDTIFADQMTAMYDNPLVYTSPRRMSKSVALEAPSLNLIAGITPSKLNEVFPEGSWDQGFTSRIIFIHGIPQNRYRNFFSQKPKPDMSHLISFLKEILSTTSGPFEWSKPALEGYLKWYNEERKEPVPDHPRLRYYNSRRDIHIAKLSMISAISAGHGLTVHLSDFQRAQNWLFTAERAMPDVFRAMVPKSDKQILDDVQHLLWDKYAISLKNGKQPLKEADLWEAFNNKTTADKIPILVSALEKTGRVRKDMGGRFIPNPPGMTLLEEGDA